MQFSDYNFFPDAYRTHRTVLHEVSLITSAILEYCDELLEKAFAAATKKLGKVGSHVTKTFQMFNLE